MLVLICLTGCYNALISVIVDDYFLSGCFYYYLVVDDLCDVFVCFCWVYGWGGYCGLLISFVDTY